MSYLRLLVVVEPLINLSQNLYLTYQWLGDNEQIPSGRGGKLKMEDRRKQIIENCYKKCKDSPRRQPSLPL